MSSISTNEEPLNKLLDQLDLKASQHVGEQAEGHWVCKRRHPRHPFRSECWVRFFPQGSDTVGKLPGRTRNLSRSGVGFLVRKVFSLGEATEVELIIPGKPPMFMAGMVSFCRYAGRGYHEIGMALKNVGAEPLFSQDPDSIIQSVDWLRESLEQR